ncbi:MAG: RNA polymerase sigma factor [Proteobacteria bacterium]|nr:RNA polymerase sigma factor [Pseudomonadota bacterium]
MTTDQQSSQQASTPLIRDVDDLGGLLRRGYRYALSLTHDEASAEDLVQDAWLSLLKAGSARTPAYLFQVLRSRFIDRYRRQRLVVMTGMEEVEEPHSEQSSSADLVIEGDLIRRALSQLRSEEREAIFLSAVEGYTGEEISALTGRSPGAVRTMLHRARAKMRNSIIQQQSNEVTA